MSESIEETVELKQMLREEMKQRKNSMTLEQCFREMLQVNRSLALFLAQEIENKRELGQLPLKVCSYMAMPDELSLEQLMKYELSGAVAAGDVEFYIPKCIVDAQGADNLSFGLWRGQSDCACSCACSSGLNGIVEARDEDIQEDLQPDVVLVPGVAFDLKGHRLGRGKGYYDNYLSSLTKSGTKVQTIAVMYSVQLCTTVPYASHDVLMQAIAVADYDDVKII